MKHTGQCRLQARVTSISSSVPRRSWRAQVPQPVGQGDETAQLGLGGVLGSASEVSQR